MNAQHWCWSQVSLLSLAPASWSTQSMRKRSEPVRASGWSLSDMRILERQIGKHLELHFPLLSDNKITHIINIGPLTSIFANCHFIFLLHVLLNIR